MLPFRESWFFLFELWLAYEDSAVYVDGDQENAQAFYGSLCTLKRSD